MQVLRWILDKYFIKQPRLRRWVTRIIYGDTEREVTLFGTKLCVHSIKENGYLRASEKAARLSAIHDEVPILLALCALLRDGDTFVDVGANVGLFARTIARMQPLVRDLTVYAFEPALIPMPG
jgi:hypothetical protein